MKYCYIFLFFVLSVGVMGQGSDPTPAPTPPFEPAGAPVDGGVFALLAAGVSYGFYKFKKKTR